MVEAYGNQNYKMFYLAKVKLSDSCHGYHNDEKKRFYISSPQTNRADSEPEPASGYMKSSGYRLVKSGGIVELSGVVNFSKRESGWHGYEIIF